MGCEPKNVNNFRLKKYVLKTYLASVNMKTFDLKLLLSSSASFM